MENTVEIFVEQDGKALMTIIPDKDMMDEVRALVLRMFPARNGYKIAAFSDGVETDL